MEKTIQEKYIDLINELYRSFDFFNQHFCKGVLHKPIITIQGDKRAGSTYGWFGKAFWKEIDDSKLDELNLTAESLHRKPEEVLETLIHEMAHLKNAQENIFDCTSTQYHNGAFKKTAEFFGLEVSKMRGKGWAKTNLGQVAKDAIELLKPNTELYGIVRNPPERIQKDPKTISLSVDVSYLEKIDFLEQTFGKKREFTEAAIDMLYNSLQNNENGDI